MTTGFLYGQLILNLLEVKLSDMSAVGSAYKCALLKSTYTPDQDEDVSYNDIKADEITGTNYSAGGVAVSTKTVAYLARVTTFGCDPITFANLTATGIRYAAIYDSTPAGDTNKKLVALFDLEADLASTATNFVLAVNESGVFAITVAAEA